MNTVDEQARALPWAHSKPLASGVIRACPADFQVDEVLGYSADGDGEHQLLQVEKSGRDTAAVARLLAQFCQVPLRDVAFAGRKDRHAVTRQWFSVRLPGAVVPDWSAFAHEGVRILAFSAHRRKLRRGALKGNRFSLRVTRLCGPTDDVERRLGAIASGGVPNYFGEQRYGRNGANLDRARAWFEHGRGPRGRDARGFALSAARSFLFDRVLGLRIADESWNQVLPGERVVLDGSRSFFVADEVDVELKKRLAAGDIHPSGPLWGRGAAAIADGGAAALERRLATDEAAMCAGLERQGLKAERRALRCIPRQLEWQIDDDVLSLQFFLPSGSYATSVLREIVNLA